MLGGSFKNLDEKVFILQNPDIQNLSNVKKLFQTSFSGGPYYRPLVSLSYMLEYHFFKDDAFFYNLIGPIVHFLTVIVVFYVIGHLFNNYKIAFFSCLLFAIHPVQWDAVARISSRTTVLCGFFYLSALLCFLRSFDGKHKKTYYLLSLIGFTAALFSRESALTFPVIAFAYMLIVQKEKVKNMFWRLVPFIVPAIPYFLLRKAYAPLPVSVWANAKEMLLGMATFLYSLIQYLLIFIIPVGFHDDHVTALFKDFFDIQLIVTFLFFVALGSLLYRFKRKISPVLWFLMIAFFVEFLPLSQIVPLVSQPGYISAQEHFLYIPSVYYSAWVVFMLFLLYTKAAEKRIISNKGFAAIAAGLYVFLLAATFQQNIYAGNEIMLLRQSLSYNPYNLRIRNSLGMAYIHRGLLQNGQEEFLKALAVDPLYAKARINLGRTLYHQGRYWESIEEYEKVRTHDPNDAAFIRQNLVESYQRLSEQYSRLIEHNPQNARAYYGLGLICSKNNDILNAVSYYRKAVELDPGFREGIYSLAVSYDSLGRFEEAVFWLQKITDDSENDSLSLDARSRLNAIHQRLAGNKEK